MHMDVRICVSTTSWNTPDVAWVVGKAAMVCGTVGSCVFSSGSAQKVFWQNAPFVLHVCVYVHPSYTGHGAWYHLYKPLVDLHGLMPITFNLVQRGWDRESIKGRFEVYLYIWDENCWSSFSTIVFCSRDSVSSSHRLDRAKVEPVSLFKTNLNRCNVNVNLLLLSTGFAGERCSQRPINTTLCCSFGKVPTVVHVVVRSLLPCEITC